MNDQPCPCCGHDPVAVDMVFQDDHEEIQTLKDKIERMTEQLEDGRKLAKESYDAAVQFKAERDAAVRDRDAAVEALRELVEVAILHGDNDLSHPADDPKTWTARMQTAWDDAEAVIAKISGSSS